MKRLFVLAILAFCMMGHVASDYRGDDPGRWSKLKNDEVIGKATWYGTAPFKGNRTPSGIICDGRTPQAAHKTLPFGLVVRVCAIDPSPNKPERCVVVVITDRGPYVDGRVIDLNAKWSINRLCDKPCGMADVVIDVVDDKYACMTFRCLSKHFGKHLEKHEIEELGLTWPPK